MIEPYLPREETISRFHAFADELLGIVKRPLSRAEVVEGALESARGKASSLLTGAINASQKFSKNLVDSINKYKASQMRAADEEDEEEELEEPLPEDSEKLGAAEEDAQEEQAADESLDEGIEKDGEKE